VASKADELVHKGATTIAKDPPESTPEEGPEEVDKAISQGSQSRSEEEVNKILSQEALLGSQGMDTGLESLEDLKALEVRSSRLHPSPLIPLDAYTAPQTRRRWRRGMRT
jgi:hypothetical protein